MPVITPRPPQTVILVYDDGATLVFPIAGREPPVQGVVWGNMKGNMHNRPPEYFDVQDESGRPYPGWVGYTEGTLRALPPACYWEDGHLVCCDT